MISLPIAGYRQVYDMSHVDKALAGEAERGDTYLRKTLDKMRKLGSTRYLLKPSRTDALDGLEALCPNFKGVIEDLKKYLHLAVEGEESMSFMPILLAGEPGVGKTHFAKLLAKALGMDYEFCSMGSMTAGWILSGASPTWHGARYGKVAQKLIEGETANPVFVLDELDKVGVDSRHDPTGTLLQLLESETAEHFKDEFLDLAIDASTILWVATANDLSRISSPVLDRFSVHEVPNPTPEEAARIAALVYGGLLKAHKWKFEPELSDSVKDSLTHTPPRELKKQLVNAMGTALTKGRRHLVTDDIRPSRPAKQGIGFTR